MSADVPRNHYRYAQAHEMRLREIRERLQQSGQPPTWAEALLLAGEASELGESCWHMGRQNAAERYWQQATIIYHRAFDKHAYIFGSDSYQWLRYINLLNLMRMSRLDNSTKALQNARHKLTQLSHELNERPTPLCPWLEGAVQHLLGLAWGGTIFGLPDKPKVEESLFAFSASELLLQDIDSSTAQEFYRNLLFSAALLLHHLARRDEYRAKIRAAQASAKRYNDKEHAQRAVLFLGLGPQAERIWHLRQWRAKMPASIDVLEGKHPVRIDQVEV